MFSKYFGYPKLSLSPIVQSTGAKHFFHFTLDHGDIQYNVHQYRAGKYSM